MSDDLLPCPFCGGPPRTFPLNGTTQATCAGGFKDCAGADGYSPVAMWNRRSAAPVVSVGGLSGPSAQEADTHRAADGTVIASADTDHDAVYEEVLVTLETAAKTVGKNICDELYGSLLEAVQDYLKENVRFNIASALAAAERGRRDAWIVSHELGDALQTVRDYVSDASKGHLGEDSPSLREMAAEDLARIDAALAVVRHTPRPASPLPAAPEGGQ